MNRHQLIEEIRQFNRSVTPEFLRNFDEETLHHYLRRLTMLHGHRGPDTAWIRDTPRPAVTMRLCA